VRQTMSRLVALVLFSAVVAGCLAEPRAPPPEDRGLPGLPPEYTREYPRAKCIDGTLLNLLGDWGRNVTGCNVRTTVTHKGNEVTIAVNPKDPGNIVAGAKDYTNPAPASASGTASTRPRTPARPGRTSKCPAATGPG
jgi:hypothetical protein